VGLVKDNKGYLDGKGYIYQEINDLYTLTHELSKMAMNQGITETWFDQVPVYLYDIVNSSINDERSTLFPKEIQYVFFSCSTIVS
jgi:hypothetical protein